MTRWLQAAEQATAPRTKPTEPTKHTPEAHLGRADAPESRVLSVTSVLSEGGNPAGAPVGAIDLSADEWPHGTACDLDLFPRTWTGRVVSLAAWRTLTDWEREGPRGRRWNAMQAQWAAPAGRRIKNRLEGEQ